MLVEKWPGKNFENYFDNVYSGTTSDSSIYCNEIKLYSRPICLYDQWLIGMVKQKFDSFLLQLDQKVVGISGILPLF